MMDTTCYIDSIFAAIDKRDTAAVQQALAAGLSPNACIGEGETLLHRACSLGEAGFEIARLLLQAGADVNRRQTDGTTALDHYIICSSYEDLNDISTDLCKLLLSYGADVNIRGRDGKTPLHNAAFFGRESILECLIQAGAEINVTDNEGETPLTLAALNAATPKKTELLLKAGAAPNVRLFEENGESALDRAITDMCVVAREKGERTVYLLRRFGGREGFYMERPVADESAESPTKQLLRAADNNDAAALLRQLEAGANINAYGDSFFGAYTALMKAARFGLPELVLLLLEHGADAKLRDSKGLTALSHAVHGDSAECIRLLLAAGINPHDEPRSLLHRAAGEGYVRALVALLRHTDLDPLSIEDRKTPRQLAEEYFTEASIECGYGDIIVLLQRAEKTKTARTAG